VHPYLRLVRAGNLGVSFVGTLVGGLAALGHGWNIPGSAWQLLALAAASTTCVTAGGNVLNDLLDRDSDRINHPSRPLVTGEIRPGSARTLAIGLFVGSAVLVVPVVLAAPIVALILAVALGALLGYEFRWKSEGFAGNLLVAFLTAAVFLYGGAAVGAVELVLPFAGMAFLATLSREVIKDMEDARGDVDRRTLPRTRGMAAAGLVARSAVVAAVLLSPVPLLTFLSGRPVAGIIYLAIVAVADVVFLLSVLWLPERLHREQTLSKGAMTIALLAFLATSFR
jgi:geranylgeranylglycerol-phosphate geranylgeranyltransferase